MVIHMLETKEKHLLIRSYMYFYLWKSKVYVFKDMLKSNQHSNFPFASRIIGFESEQS